MTPEAIAAEVAAKYGIPVSPAVVKILPYRVPIEPDFFWCEKRQALIAKEGLDQTLRRTIHAQTEAMKAARNKALASNRAKQQADKARRVAALIKWAGDGVTIAALAEHMGVTFSTAEKYARENGIPILRENRLPTKDELTARRAKVAELRKQGLSISKICAVIGAGSKAIRRDLQSMGLAA